MRGAGGCGRVLLRSAIPSVEMKPQSTVIVTPLGRTGRSLPTASKSILIVAMLLGRLEILTVMILFSALFWRF